MAPKLKCQFYVDQNLGSIGGVHNFVIRLTKCFALKMQPHNQNHLFQLCQKHCQFYEYLTVKSLIQSTLDELFNIIRKKNQL